MYKLVSSANNGERRRYVENAIDIDEKERRAKNISLLGPS